MGQNNRQLIRLFFVLVIGVGLFGGWFTIQRFHLDQLTLVNASPADNRNWLDLLAQIGEQTIQLLLGLTSGQ